MLIQQHEFVEPVFAKRDVISREVICDFGDYIFKKEGGLLTVIVNGSSMNVSGENLEKINVVLDSNDYGQAFCDTSNDAIYFSGSTYTATRIIRIYLK